MYFSIIGASSGSTLLAILLHEECCGTTPQRAAECDARESRWVVCSCVVCEAAEEWSHDNMRRWASVRTMHVGISC